MVDKKPKNESPLRTPKVKRFGLNIPIPSLPSPHDAFIPRADASIAPATDAPAETAPAQIASADNAAADTASVATNPPVQTAPAQVASDDRFTGTDAQSASDESTAPVAILAAAVPARANIAPLPEDPRAAIVREYFKMPNGVFDGEGLDGLAPLSKLIYLRMLRLSIGHGRNWCKISNERLAIAEQASKRGIQYALKPLEERGLIRRVHVDGSSSKRQERGSAWEVRLPADCAPAMSAPAAGAGAPRAPMKEIMKDTSKEVLSDPRMLREARRRELLRQMPEASARDIETALDEMEGK